MLTAKQMHEPHLGPQWLRDTSLCRVPGGLGGSAEEGGENDPRPMGAGTDSCDEASAESGLGPRYAKSVGCS